MTATPRQAKREITPETVKLLASILRMTWIAGGLQTAGFPSIGRDGAAAIPGAATSTSFTLWLALLFFNFGYREATSHAAEDAAVAAAIAAAPVPEADPTIWSTLPPAPHGHGYLYTIRFTTGVVKVGQTQKPARRIAEHRRNAWAYQVVMTDVWVSEPHRHYLDSETKLIAHARTLVTWAKREYFHGADFAAVVEHARTLAGQRPQ